MEDSSLPSGISVFSLLSGTAWDYTQAADIAQAQVCFAQLAHVIWQDRLEWGLPPYNPMVHQLFLGLDPGPAQNKKSRCSCLQKFIPKSPRGSAYDPQLLNDYGRHAFARLPCKEA
jgi:hypothetical protein